MKKTDKLPAKNGKKFNKKPFRFTINRNRISNKTKELLEFEDLMSEVSYFRGLVLHGIYYNKLVWYCDNVIDLCDYNFDYGWYNSSTVLADIYDYYSVKGYVLDIDTQPYDNKGFQKSVDKLLDLFKNYSLNQLGMKRISVKKYKEVIQWFCYHLYRCHKQNKIAIKYSRDENFIKTHKINCPEFSYSIVIRLVDMLVSEGYCLSFIGNNIFENNIMSTLIVNPDLFNLVGIQEVEMKIQQPKESCVEVRKEKTIIDPIYYEPEWIDELDFVEEQLLKYNTNINKHDIWIGEYEIPYVWFKRIYRDDIETCARIFDDGTIQGKSKQVRSGITIDKEKTVSLDLKSLHPRLLYLLEGIELPDSFDPYPDVDIKLDNKLINRFKDFYGIESYNPIRNLCKVMLLSLLNAKDENGALGACFEAISKDWTRAGTSKEQRMRFVGLKKGYSLKDISKQIRLKNVDIEKYFCTGYGNKLQKMDSDIIMNCLSVLTVKNIPVIPVHDALICKESDKDYVKSVMEESFGQVMGSIINCVIEEE